MNRLRARRTLPGERMSDWLEGWWQGIAVGFVSGLAAACFVYWSGVLR